ncbi:hypothetical protein MNBD_ALPHA09-1585 [hydrothermal vent metagenome]|uniref:HTH cro/C1-type domain-containing protein n=1 Tax=hydrothermal vent metagenome TaxID=652676 RepID=A0A3B0TEY5_9ZZZZ
MTQTNDHTPAPDEDDPTGAYKTLLRQVIANRPSGVRNRLAQALGKNKSFISQITNPAYDTPIPAAHLEAIFEIVHFSTDERTRFDNLYARAHPRHGRAATAGTQMRRHTVLLPDLGTRARNREIDDLVDDFMGQLAKILTRSTPRKKAGKP